MATTMTVPRRYQGGFAKVRDLPDGSIQELLAALQKIPPSTVNAASLASAVAEMTDTIAASDIEEIVPVLLHLHSIREVSRLPIPDVAEGIARGMEEVASRQRSSEEDREPFQARLVELLGVDSLSVVARAGGLFFENEHSLRQTRIVTDIRPVFEQDHRQAPPRGAVIVHTLRISYWADNEAKDFFVALDANDVRELLEQLEWANTKAESLKSILDAAQVPYIGGE